MEKQTLRHEGDDSSVICGHCNGSGEGMADGTRCSICRGCGEVPPSEDDTRSWELILTLHCEIPKAEVQKLEDKVYIECEGCGHVFDTEDEGHYTDGVILCEKCFQETEK